MVSEFNYKQKSFINSIKVVLSCINKLYFFLSQIAEEEACDPNDPACIPEVFDYYNDMGKYNDY